MTTTTATLEMPMQKQPPEQILYNAHMSKQPTVTRRVFSTQQLDENGMLTIRIPCGKSLAHAILKVEIRIDEPIPEPMPTPEELGWPTGFFEETYGCLEDDILERSEQGEYEVREVVGDLPA